VTFIDSCNKADARTHTFIQHPFSNATFLKRSSPFSAIYIQDNNLILTNLFRILRKNSSKPRISTMSSDIFHVSPGIPLLFVAALLAGVVNGVAGGGGLIVFPTLLMTGTPAIAANATNAAGLWFGTAASTIAYRDALAHLRWKLFCLTTASVAGGVIGSSLLLHTAETTFAALIPYLMLISTVIFAIGQPLMTKLKQTRSHSSIRLPLAGILLIQFSIAIYIGFYGGGAGILMLAALNFMGLKDVHEMNAVKSWLATCTNGVAIAHFIMAQAVVWSQVTVLAIAAMIGGYASALFAQRLPQAWVRYFVIGVGLTLTGYFFWSNSQSP
jgi:uncharacterized membrane protein YfcA